MEYYNYAAFDTAPITFERQRHPANLGFHDEEEYRKINLNKVDNNILDNIIEYNKNLTPDEINGTTANNILKYNNLLTLSEFDKMRIAQQYQRLLHRNTEANKLLEEEFQEEQFTNLPLSEISNRFVKTMTEIVQELPDAIKDDGVNVEMFIKNGRQTYVGILFLIIAFMFYFISVTS